MKLRHKSEIALAGILAILALAFLVRLSRAQEPTPPKVDQHYRVEYGDIEKMQEKLHQLNAEGVSINDNEWFVSQDGKRFTIVVHEHADDEDGER